MTWIAGLGTRNMSSVLSFIRRCFFAVTFVLNKIRVRFGAPRMRRHLTSINISEARFDAEDYLSRYSDVANAGISAYNHFCTFGYLEGRSGRFFDDLWYIRQYPDVALLGGYAWRHFDRYGRREGRAARYIVIQAAPIASDRNNYSRWLKEYNQAPTPETPDSLPDAPLISIVMATYNSHVGFLRAAIESVLAQDYPKWELCIADDASTQSQTRDVLSAFAAKDHRIKIVFRDTNGHISAASNSALNLTSGQFVGFLDHDDLLTPDALSAVVSALRDHADANLVYSDEDKIDEDGRRFDPYFKPDFNYELFLAQNMISHFGVYRTDVIRNIGGFRLGFEGSQDHDLALRVVERSTPGQIIHIPRVLYHWRAIAGSTALNIDEKSYAPRAGLRAVAAHLERRNVKAIVQPSPANPAHYRVRYNLLLPHPKISIIIPTRDHVDVLRTCVSSIIRLTRYPNYEIIIVDNGSKKDETLKYFTEIESDKISIVSYDIPFNYSKINNLGVEHATGSYICLMNNDIEIITPDWLEEMLSFAQWPDIGCVGARLWYPDKSLQHGGVLLGIGGVAGHAFKYSAQSFQGYFCRAIHHQSYSAVTAACLLIKKDIYMSVGGLDEALAVAFNDVDFCLRVREAGYRNIWTPYAEMIHHESVSRGHEVTPEKKKRFQDEVDFMVTRWGDRLKQDPAYNPNLTLEYEDFSLAWPPRRLNVN